MFFFFCEVICFFDLEDSTMTNHHHSEKSASTGRGFANLCGKKCQPLSHHPPSTGKGLHFLFQPIDAKQREQGFCQTKLDYEN